jgi:hypothetical protein
VGVTDADGDVLEIDEEGEALLVLLTGSQGSYLLGAFNEDTLLLGP